MVSKAVIRQLEEASKNAGMKTASFSNDPAEDARIKEAVRLYMQTWVIGYIDDVIDHLKGDKPASELRLQRRRSA